MAKRKFKFVLYAKKLRQIQANTQNTQNTRKVN